MKTYGWIIIIGVIAICAAVWYYLTRKLSAIEEMTKQVTAENPTLSTAEIAALVAEAVAKAVLETAQASDEAAGVAAAAQAAADAEAANAAAQALASATLEAAAIAAAAAAAAAAEQARQELINAWSASLAIVEQSVLDSKAAVAAATTSWDGVTAKLVAAQQKLASIRGMTLPVVWLFGDANYSGGRNLMIQGYPVGDYPSMIGAVGNDAASSLKVIHYFGVELFGDSNFGGRSQKFEAIHAGINVPNLSDQYITNDAVSSLRVYFCTQDLENAIVSIQAEADRIRLSVVAATSYSFLCIERALTIIADLRLLNILSARIASLEASVVALRNSTAALKAKVGG